MQLSEQRNIILDSIDIRNMSIGDLPFWADIEESSFLNPWLENDWYEFQENICNRSIAACYDNCLVGYALYTENISDQNDSQNDTKDNDKYLEIVKLVVHPSLRRGGVGSKLVHNIKLELDKECNVLSTVLDERNVPGQMFLKKHKFNATFVKRKFFDEGTPEVMDGYLFEYHKDK